MTGPDPLNPDDSAWGAPPEWVGLADLGGEFGWTARYMGYVFNRMQLRHKGVPIDKAIELGLTKKSGGKWLWDKSKLVPLLEHFGVPPLSPLDRIAWRTVDRFLMLVVKARDADPNKKPGPNEIILEAVTRMFDAIPAKGQEGRWEMIVAIDKHMALSGVQEKFRADLYGAMGENGQEIVAEAQALIMTNTTEQPKKHSTIRRL